jgi:pimeloyl-ACP methyl ester carboxylesterase
MNTPADHTTRASHSSSVPSVQETSYLSCPEGRIGYDVAGGGPLVILVPGLGDLRAGYRFLAPALRAAGYRVACTDLRGHGDSDATFSSYGDEETAGDIIALIGELGGPAVVVGNSMGAGAAVLAAAQRPGITTGAVLSFLESVNGPAQAGLIRPGMSEEPGRIADEVIPVAGPEVTAASSLAPPLPGPAAQ